MLTLIANIESYGDAGFIAWCDNFKGMVVQAKSGSEAFMELLHSLKVKIAYDYSIPFSEIKQKEITKHENYELNWSPEELQEGKKVVEFNFEPITLSCQNISASKSLKCLFLFIVNPNALGSMKQM